jgi:dihydrofolate synthase / folylpolyglutamate synthase
MVAMPHWPKYINTGSRKDLDDIYKVLEKLGNPQNKLPKTIHIAGTNGKGSTCAMLYEILIKSGYKACMYTSPHILEFNERIKINGGNIDDDSLYHYLEKVRAAYEELGIDANFFDATTIAAFLAFSDSDSDFLVLETGIGGRIDATNTILQPICTIITPISYDHMNLLGNDIKQIASEKAGIIKKDVACIVSRQAEEVNNVLFKYAEQQNAPVICYEYDYIVQKNLENFSFFSRFGDITINNFSLKGDHQIINASAVLACSMLLARNYNKISQESIINALSHVDWRGRLQKIKLSKIFKNQDKEIWIDGAHNISGAAALCNWLSEQNFKEISLVVGMTKNRDIPSFLGQFSSLKNIKFYSVSVMSEYSSYSAEKFSEIASNSNFDVRPLGTLVESLEYLLLNKPNSEIIIAGSLYLVSDVMKIIKGS